MSPSFSRRHGTLATKSRSGFATTAPAFLPRLRTRCSIRSSRQSLREKEPVSGSRSAMISSSSSMPAQSKLIRNPGCSRNSESFSRGRGRPHRGGARVSVLLVIDDEEDVELLFRQRFRHDLKAGRFVMEFAQSASAALQRIANVGSASLILIFSDINLPGMSGLELLPKARAARPDVPVIMITAYGDAETRQKALDAGAEARLTKPIDFGTLRDHIEMRLERAA